MNDTKRKKTIGYILIFSFLVTMVTFISPRLGGSLSSPGPGLILWMTAPLLVAVLMRTITRDWSDAGLKPAIRKNARWYLLSALAGPVATVFTLLLGTMFSISSVSGFSTAQFLKAFLPALPIFFITSIFEEFGWRGYLVPKLASIGINSYLASAVVAVIWATWHLPYLRDFAWMYGMYSSEELLTSIIRFYLYMFAYSILYNEIRLITDSVWPAVVMHCFKNSIGHPLFALFVTVAAGQDYLGSPTGLFMSTFIALLGITLNRWRMKKRLPEYQAAV